jgi:starch phosphorylase
VAYTNHTLLPEALEKWPVDMLERIIPRHMEIIYQINQRLMEQVGQRYPGDSGKMARMSLIEEGHKKMVRMMNLSVVGSMSVNGVARMHSELVKNKLAPDFYEFWPDKFNNKTNGVTPRRWLYVSNVELSELITDNIGKSWVTNLSELSRLRAKADDGAFVEQFFKIKDLNKHKLAEIIKDTTGVTVDTRSMFDVQVKRIHEYKRQLLNALHIAYQYLTIVDDGHTLPAPKTYIFGGKAAPSYEYAKLIIKFINNLGMLINNDPRVKGQMKVVYVPDYRVSLAERIFPASDLSEQISTAGYEASGTGNMKFMINGAVTIGTLDGANVEIREEVGADNFYLFGLNVDEVHAMQAKGTHRPWDIYNADPRVKKVIEAITNNRFSPDEPDLFKPIFKNLMFSDYYLLLADLGAYIDTQNKALEDYTNKKVWGRKAVLNMACSGKFSSDRTIAEYARDIWHVESTLEKGKK